MMRVYIQSLLRVCGNTWFRIRCHSDTQPSLLKPRFPENRGKVGDNPNSQIIPGKAGAGKGASEARELQVKEDRAVRDEVTRTPSGM